MEKKYKKIMVTTKKRNPVISSCIICFTNAREYSEEMLRRLTIKYLEKVAKFSMPTHFLKLP